MFSSLQYPPIRFQQFSETLWRKWKNYSWNNCFFINIIDWIWQGSHSAEAPCGLSCGHQWPYKIADDVIVSPAISYSHWRLLHRGTPAVSTGINTFLILSVLNTNHWSFLLWTVYSSMCLNWPGSFLAFPCTCLVILPLSQSLPAMSPSLSMSVFRG